MSAQTDLYEGCDNPHHSTNEYVTWFDHLMESEARKRSEYFSLSIYILVTFSQKQSVVQMKELLDSKTAFIS